MTAPHHQLPLVVFVVAAIAAASCGRPENSWPAAAIAPVDRMFGGDPLPRLELASSMRPSPVQSWDLADPAARAAWRHRGREGVTTTADGYALDARKRRQGTVVQFMTPVGIAAREVDAILVAFEGRRSPALRLGWAAAGERCGRGDVRRPPVPASADGRVIVRFPIASDPEWRGEIEKICLSVLANSAPVELQYIALVQERFEPEDCERDGRRFRARLAAETRPAFLGGCPTTWSVDIASDSRLEFGFGTTARGSGIIKVIAATAQGEETLFSAAIGPDAELPPDRWHAAHVDLTPWAGESVTLRFETESPDGNRGCVLWSEPTILGPTPPARLPNLVLLSLDTLRPDHLSLYGYERPTSPRIDEWAEHGVVFEHAVTSSPWTLPAHLSLLTGLDALSHGVNHRTAVSPRLDLLAARLRSLGYQTFAVTGGGFMHADIGFDHGFDRYRFWANRKASDDEIQSTVAAALEWVEEFSDRPFFLFVHTYEIHHPYRFREPYFSSFLGVEPPPRTALSYISNGREMNPATLLTKWPSIKAAPDPARRLEEDSLPMLVAAYDSGIAHADREIGRLLARLSEPSLAARTATVLTSDHGEALGEKGYAGHLYLEEFNTRIPLVLRLPGIQPQGRRIESQVGIVDLYPTLLELAGDPVDRSDIDGRSVLRLARGSATVEPVPAWTYASLSRRGLGLSLDHRWKYVLNNSAASELLGTEALYDLAADPDESENLAADHPRTWEFRRMALGHIAQKSSGLRLQFRNPTAVPLVFALSGPDVNVARAKAATLDPDRLSWVDGQVLWVTLPMDAETVLFFEGAERHKLKVAISSESAKLFELALGSVETPARVAWRAGSLVLASGGGPNDTTVLDVDWQGIRGASTDHGDEREIEQQLRALGYLN